MTEAVPEQVLEWILIDEGGLTNDPDDDLGITKYGVTKPDLQELWGRKITDKDIEELDLEGAKDVFRRRYWNPLKCSELPPPIAYLVMDAGLLHGVYRSAIWLQKAVGVKMDGQIGPKTIEAARKADVEQVIKSITGSRMARARSHPDYRKFGRGWINRFTRVKTRALKLMTNKSL